ncbi:hypothetical protein Taro_016671 [Colocasia esculenta]|uniref:Uncharacterized protein n=1 Tax=Colocasia esculenta TaxID=4460 RepID=A0A843UP71_COLES|nr:hypothetical protein [Colocasia esculenta]
MRPFTDWIEGPIPNWGLAGGSDPRADRYPRLIEGYGCRCTITHAPGWNFGPGTEFRKTSAMSTVSECRFRIVVTISAMFEHPYQRPGEEISRRVEHDF